jgi:hypothetical protein
MAETYFLFVFQMFLRLGHDQTSIQSRTGVLFTLGLSAGFTAMNQVRQEETERSGERGRGREKERKGRKKEGEREKERERKRERERERKRRD